MSHDPLISFIIPVYNEEDNIVNVLGDVHSVVDRHREWNAEVVVIEDGSKDNTRAVLLEVVKNYPETHVILHPRNMGYTASLKDGLAKARGRYLMYVGADEEFDCSEIPNFVNQFLNHGTEQADVVLGVRWQRNAYKLHRFFLSVIYIFLLNFLFKLRVNDYNWSQGWSRDFLQRIQLRSRSLFVLPEIIIKAHDLGLRVKEVPSNHRGRRTGRSSVNLRIMGHALLEALSFCRRRASAKYSPLT